MDNKKQKILIIEDDLYIRDVYEEVLKEAGYDITTAVDGQEGVLKAQEGGFDLILLDVMMPKMDGLGVLAALRDKPAKAENGRIVMLTNLAHDSIIQEAQKLGAYSHLVKSSLNPDELVQKVKGLLGS
ncbi:MAG TPA: response regulator [Patescibacteria group bacterium]|nr:response regulator [Patescibacteria group bacterium]